MTGFATLWHDDAPTVAKGPSVGVPTKSERGHHERTSGIDTGTRASNPSAALHFIPTASASPFGIGPERFCLARDGRRCGGFVGGFIVCG